MESRPYSLAQHSILAGWWVAHGYPPVSPEMLPPTGIIIWQGLQPLVAGFLYLTSSKLCLFEGMISNPESDRIERGRAVDMLIDSVMKLASDNKATAMMIIGNHPKLLKRFINKGFLTGETNMTTLIGRVS